MYTRTLTYTCACTYMYIRIHTYSYPQTCIRTYMHTYKDICTYTHTGTDMHVPLLSVCVSIYFSLFLPLYTHTHTPPCTHTCTIHKAFGESKGSFYVSIIIFDRVLFIYSSRQVTIHQQCNITFNKLWQSTFGVVFQIKLSGRWEWHLPIFSSLFMRRQTIVKC